MKLLNETLDAIIVRRPRTGEMSKQNLCADKGYVGAPAAEAIRRRNYIPHVRQRGEEIAAAKSNPQYRPRRWVVERTHSWLNRYRKVLVRYEKTAASYEGLLELTCALIAFRQTIVICG